MGAECRSIVSSHLCAETISQSTSISAFGGAELLKFFCNFSYWMDPAHLSLLLVDSETEGGPPK